MVYINHYGVARRSGRYPWGSGDDAYQRSGDFLSRVQSLKKIMSEKEVAKTLDLSINDLRYEIGWAKDFRRSLKVNEAESYRKKGMTPTEIAKKMNLKNESVARSLLDIDAKGRMLEAADTADFIKERIKKSGIIDIGSGVEKTLNISEYKLNYAAYMLQKEGYPVYTGSIPQVTNNKQRTTMKVICPKGTKRNDLGEFENVSSLHEYTSTDGGRTYHTIKKPISIDSNRIKVRYKEDGGIEKDGLIEIRRGVKDLNLGKSTYAQVRILTDNSHYLKGMAIYSDDMPKGVDIMFNTNKSKDVSKMNVFKPIKDGDPLNPFGAALKAGGQSYYIDNDGKRKMSVLNKVKEEGDWGKYSKNLPSQFLAKQNIPLIKKQINLSIEAKRKELDDILNLTNPTIKKKMLLDFANTADADSTSLHTVPVKNQKYHVFIPIPNMKAGEVYAPNYKDGDKISIVRFPHAGTFEIPTLTVNNKHKEAKKLLGNALDAIGINSPTAEKMSGADFDGDFGIVFGRKETNIKSTNTLKGLEGFDPKMQYPYRKGMKIMTKNNTQFEMGSISNLISDMDTKGATINEITRAVKHSMVVIDAEKHKLNYKQSAIDNDILTLKRKYQGYNDATGKRVGGASTLMTRASSVKWVPKRVGTPHIDKDTGRLVYKTLNDDKLYYVDKKGNKVQRKEKSKQMLEIDDAFKLSSGTIKEDMYAGYANELKNLANTARIKYKTTKGLHYNPEINKANKELIDNLERKLLISESNAPKERLAQSKANKEVKEKIALMKQKGQEIEKSDLKKLKQQALERSREKVGASRTKIDLTKEEWNVINAGGITNNKLERILKYADGDVVKDYATPRPKTTIPIHRINKIKSMLNNSKYSLADIANANGISLTTLNKYLEEI